jgi:hypothetical protein
MVCPDPLGQRMPLYRFYRIVSSAGEECYVGSTTQPLNKRLICHKANHKRGSGTASCILFAKYGVETCSIVLISEQEMEKVDALREERRLIEECSSAVNKVRPIIEKEEVKDVVKERRRKYREEHREEEKERHRKYREEHREEEKEQHRKWREKHREAINAYYSEKIQCDVCGRTVNRSSMTEHKRTKSCQASK